MGVYNEAFEEAETKANNPAVINGENDSHDKVEIADDSSTTRPKWGNSLEFLFSCISVSVGLGNVWRFPFTAYENGGGAFLVPYIIVLLLIGKPMYYFEMILGQFTSKGSVKALQALPIMKGVGVAQQISVTCVVSYYCSLIALVMFYLIKSFSAELPWSKCRPEWNEFNCVDATSINSNMTNGTSSSEIYFVREVIKQKDDISDGIGLPDWQLSLFLFLAWTAVFLVISKGVRTSGKAAYFLAIFPYVVMIALLIRAVTLEGAIDGIKFFITPDFSRLLEPRVWYEAITQLFFSLSVGMGSIIMFSSYNRFDHNIHRDAMIVTTLDTFTSLLAGFTIFGILGNLAHNLGEPDISKVVKNGGSALAFISYPDAMSKFTFAPQVFSALFFTMMLVLSVGSAVGLQSSVVTNLMDVFPKVKIWKISGSCCLFGFLVGLVYVTPGGQWVLNLADFFGGTFLVLVLAILELVGIFWVYGLESFCLDIEFMLNRKVSPFWRISWFVITPVLMIVILIYFLVLYKSPTFMNLPYPVHTMVGGWFIFILGLAQIVIWAVWLLTRDEFKGKKSVSVKFLFKPDPQWGPKSPKTRHDWIIFKSERMEMQRFQFNDHSKFKRMYWTLMGKY